MLRLLSDRDLALRMGPANLERVLRGFTIETHAVRKLAAIVSLYTTGGMTR